MSIIYNGQTVAGVYAEQILNNADTINAGIIKIATQEEVDAGENNTSAVTPLYLSSKQNKLESGDNISIENDIISCDIKPDVSTIIQNEDGTLTNVGQLTKSGTIKIDWEGTEAEYTRAMLNGEIDPNWYCYITDDESLVDYADVANQSLSNLRPEGEARFDEKADKATTLEGYGITNGLNKNQITNCLLEVPQRINLTLSDGTLTLKKGSVVTVPYGTTNRTSEFPVGSQFLNSNWKVVDTQFADNKFFVWAELQQDISRNRTDIDGQDRFISVYLDGNINGATASQSGASFSSSGLGYNTSENTVYWYNTSGVVQGGQLAFPIGIVACSDTYTFGSIKQVFNGMGYVGRTLWLDKGVKVLIGTGRNADGTIKNTEITTKLLLKQSHTYTEDRLLLYKKSGALEDILPKRYLTGLKKDMPATVSETVLHNYFCTDTLETYWTSGSTTTNWRQAEYKAPIGIYGAIKEDDGKTITFLNPYQAFRAVDYNDYRTEVDSKVSKAGDTMTGPLTIHYSAENTLLALKSDKIDITQAPSSNGGIAFRMLDKNNKQVGLFEQWNYTSGEKRVSMRAVNSVSGTEKTCQLVVAVDANGNAFTVAPTPVTGDNSTKIATTAYCVNMATTTAPTTTSSASKTRPAWVVENYVNGTSWYRIWSDGWCEQGQNNRTIGGAGNATINLLKAYKDTNYTVTLACGQNSSYAPSIQSRTTTSFTGGVLDRARDWYACGYIK